MEKLTNREKDILACLCRGLADKSHREKAGNQLSNHQLASAQPMRQIFSQKQCSPHVSAASIREQSFAGISRADTSREQHPAHDHAGLQHRGYCLCKRHQADDSKTTAPRAYSRKDRKRQYPGSGSTHSWAEC